MDNTPAQTTDNAPRSLRHLSVYLATLVKGRLWLKVLIGMGLGLVVGTLLGPSVGLVEPETGTLIGNWLAFPGQLFLATIQMIVIPLVIASVVRGLAASDNLEQLRKMGIRVTLFFVITTAIAATIGLWVGGLVNPGDLMTGLDAIPQTLIGLLPGNPLDAMVEGQMLQVVIFSIIIGVALVSMSGDKAKPMLDLLDSLQQICMTVVRWAMHLAPYAVFGLMAQLTTTLGFRAMIGMASYVATVLFGLAVLMVFYLVILKLLAGVRPLQFLKDTRDVLLLAFSTSSSAAVMPLSIRTAEDKLGVRPSVSQFVTP
ncbi:dicarboxylate/amino acid:cation symporter [Marinobacter nauticus]|uniref:dicarboxylate/amino acid:cation symporter n=1 Tax=Marinobacter nauticus TaxID=2743 RepID=UPI001F2CFB2C|nr:dicarboxylate/amino acid:cation symporter [Marinobacter nauticus]